MSHPERFMPTKKKLTLSRAKVYADITTHLNRVSKIVARNEYLGSPPPEITAGGPENGPNFALEEYKWYCRRLNLQHLLNRLQMVFHADSLEMPPGAEWVLSNYPPDPKSFANWEGLRRDDERRVSCVVRDNNAEIRRIYRWLSDGMKLARGDLDDAVRSTIISKMESLGEQWAMLDAKSDAAVLWFEGKWGKNEPGL